LTDSFKPALYNRVASDSGFRRYTSIFLYFNCSFIDLMLFESLPSFFVFSLQCAPRPNRRGVSCKVDIAIEGEYMQAIIAILVIMIFIGVPVILFSMTYSCRLYKCSECGHTFSLRCYQSFFRLGKRDGNVLLTCPKCDKYVITNGV